MTRVAVGLEYDGTDFVGWQSQDNGRSVQAVVEEAVSCVAHERITVHGAGRTDAGVHAACQVAHFDTTADRTSRQWLLGINSNLPADVALKWAVSVPNDFDARRSAQWREYRYTIANQQARPALARRRVWWVRERLDPAWMTHAAAAWIGEHDFSSLRAANCQSASPMRRLMRVAISCDGPFVRLDFRANAFLYHMVRNMVGTLVDVGRGHASVGSARELLDQRDRTRAGATAPAQGLMLTAVRYAAGYGLPDPLPAARAEGGSWAGV